MSCGCQSAGRSRFGGAQVLPLLPLTLLLLLLLLFCCYKLWGPPCILQQLATARVYDYLLSELHLGLVAMLLQAAAVLRGVMPCLKCECC
jgi:hypothetical protein